MLHRLAARRQQSMKRYNVILHMECMTFDCGKAVTRTRQSICPRAKRLGAYERCVLLLLHCPQRYPSPLSLSASYTARRRHSLLLYTTHHNSQTQMIDRESHSDNCALKNDRQFEGGPPRRRGCGVRLHVSLRAVNEHGVTLPRYTSSACLLGQASWHGSPVLKPLPGPK